MKNAALSFFSKELFLSCIKQLVRANGARNAQTSLLPLDSASKHALQGYFDSLRAELGPRGVTVTVVSPGYIATQLSTNAVQGDGSKHGGMAIYEVSLGKQLIKQYLT